MCNQMIRESYTKNTEILNEILGLYRFIVEKYASHASQQAHIVSLVKFLKDIWDFFVKKRAEHGGEAAAENMNEEEEKEDNEINLALQSIMRIMSHVLAVRKMLILLDCRIYQWTRWTHRYHWRY